MGPSSASPGWWRRCPSPSGRRTAACATRCTSGLREDKAAAEVVREDAGAAAEAAAVRIEANRSGTPFQVEGRELKLSNLDKVLYPPTGFTKAQLIDYYAAAAPGAAAPSRRQAVDRDPLARRRGGQVVLPEAGPRPPPAVGGHGHRPGRARKPIDYVLADDLATLVWLANLAAIELHTPLARAQAPRSARRSWCSTSTPGAPASIVECCRVALTLQGTFERLGLESFAKTSGSKGLQVYVPLNRPDVTYGETKAFARTVAELLEQSEPDLVVSRMTKSRRPGKVLIDWSQNDARKTTVCVYSLRATERPSVSTPVQWEEVSGALDSRDPARLAFTPGQVLERVGRLGDLFAGALSLVQTLPDS